MLSLLPRGGESGDLAPGGMVALVVVGNRSDEISPSTFCAGGTLHEPGQKGEDGFQTD